MGKASIPQNEDQRLLDLNSYEVLDSLPEQSYNDIVNLASKICKVPISLVSLVDKDRQWFKAKVGLQADETPRDHAFCAHAILGHDVFAVEDAESDSRFKDNPLVKDGIKIRFYAGTPLISPKGYNLGTLCVIDQEPRKLSLEQLEALQALGRQVVSLLELRKSYRNELKQNQEIQQTKEKYKIVIENLKEAVFRTDHRGHFIFLSQAWEEITGFKIEESMGRSLYDFCLEKDRSESAGKFHRSVEQKKSSFQQRLKCIKKDGTEIWIEILTNLGWGNLAEFTGSTGTCLDVTLKVQDEKKIEEQRLNLASSAKMASLGEMAGGIAHEINNPLAIVAGNIQILKRKAKRQEITAETVVETTEKIEVTINRITKIIHGLRTFARDGEKDPFENVAIGRIIDCTLALCESKFSHHEIKLDVQIEDPQLNIYCQPTQISQIILNLLSNAFDAVSDQKEPWVRLRSLKKGDQLEISVSDSGSGIPAELRDKIMNPFFTTKPVGKGTGLGLSLSKTIADAHKGEFYLNLESQNTEFKLILPV